MAKKALVVFGNSKYNIHVFAAQRAEEILKNSGYDVKFVNTAAVKDPDILQYFMQNERPDYVVSFDCSGFDLELLGDDLFLNSLCCPMAHVLLTDPLFFVNYYDKRMNFVMDFYMQYGSDIDFCKTYFPRIPNIYKYVFQTYIQNKQDIVKSIDILIPSTYICPATVMEQINQLPDVFSGICHALIKECIGKPGSDVHKLLPSCLAQVGFKATREDIISLMSLAMPVMNYVKMYFVDKIVRKLLACGLNVTVCGDGWKNFSYENDSSLKVLGPVAFGTLPELMQGARIVINNQAHKSDGIHERVWMAAECNAACITDVMPENAMGNIYLYNSVDEIPDLVKNVLKKG